MRGFSIAGFVLAASAIAGACSSSSSTNAPADAGPFDVFNAPYCDSIVPIGSDGLPTGACDSSKTPGCLEDVAACAGIDNQWLCYCEDAGWSCRIGGDSDGDCGAPVADSGPDAGSSDAAADASDGDAS